MHCHLPKSKEPEALRTRASGDLLAYLKPWIRWRESRAADRREAIVSGYSQGYLSGGVEGVEGASGALGISPSGGTGVAAFDGTRTFLNARISSIEVRDGVNFTSLVSGSGSWRWFGMTMRDRSIDGLAVNLASDHVRTWDNPVRYGDADWIEVHHPP